MVIQYHGTYIDGLSFPNTVVLDNAFSGSQYSVTLGASADAIFRYNVSITLSNTLFRFRDTASSLTVQYSSNDGITYTMTSYNPGEIGFRFYIPLDINEDVLKFINTNTGDLTGIYKYSARTAAAVKPYDLTSTPIPLTSSTLSNIVKGPSTDVSFVSDIVDKLKTLSGINTLNNMILLTMNEAMTKIHFVMYYISGNISFTSPTSIYCTNNKYYYITSRTNTTDTYISGMHHFEYDINTKALTELQFTQDITFANNSDNTQYYAGQEITDKYYLGAYRYNATSQKYYLASSNMTYYADNTVNTKSNWSSSIWYSTLYKYGSAPSQLTLDNANLLYPNTTAYGMNSVITGDGSIYNNLDFTDICKNVMGLSVTNNLKVAYSPVDNDRILLGYPNTIKNKVTYLKQKNEKYYVSGNVCISNINTDKIPSSSVVGGNSNFVFSSDNSHYYFNGKIYNTIDNSIYEELNNYTGVFCMYNNKVLYYNYPDSSNTTTFDVYVYNLNTLSNRKVISNLGLSTNCTVKKFYKFIPYHKCFALLYTVQNPNNEPSRRWFYSYYYDFETDMVYSTNYLTRMTDTSSNYTYGYIRYDKDYIYTVACYIYSYMTSMYNSKTKVASQLSDTFTSSSMYYSTTDRTVNMLTDIPISNNGIYTIQKDAAGLVSVTIDYTRDGTSYKSVTYTIDKSQLPYPYSDTAIQLSYSDTFWPHINGSVGLISTTVGMCSYIVSQNNGSATDITITLLKVYPASTSIIVNDDLHDYNVSSSLYYKPLYNNTTDVVFDYFGSMSTLDYYTISDCTDYDTILITSNTHPTIWKKPQNNQE